MRAQRRSLPVAVVTDLLLQDEVLKTIHRVPGCSIGDPAAICPPAAAKLKHYDRGRGSVPGLHAEVFAAARILPIIWAANEPRLDRIAVDVRSQVDQLLIGFDRNRLELSLEESSDALVLGIRWSW